MTLSRDDYMHAGDYFMAYRCATCGTEGIRVKSVTGQPWVVSCLNGHPWVLSPAHDIEFTVHPGDDDITELTVRRPAPTENPFHKAARQFAKLATLARGLGAGNRKGAS